MAGSTWTKPRSLNLEGERWRAFVVRTLHTLTAFSLILSNFVDPTQVLAHIPIPSGSAVTPSLSNFSNMGPRLSEAVRPQPSHRTLAAQLDTVADRPAVMFIENIGQFDAGAKFLVQGERADLFLAQDAIWVTLSKPVLSETTPSEPLSPDATPTTPSLGDQPLHGVNLRLSLAGANPQAQVEGFSALDSKISYFVGSDPHEWHTDVPVYAGVRYVNIYPNVNLEITSRNGQWDWRLVAPNAEAVPPLLLQVEGADSLTSAGDRLQITTAVKAFSLPLLRVVNPAGESLPVPVSNTVITVTPEEPPTATRTGSETASTPQGTETEITPTLTATVSATEEMTSTVTLAATPTPSETGLATATESATATSDLDLATSTATFLASPSATLTSTNTLQEPLPSPNEPVTSTNLPALTSTPGPGLPPGATPLGLAGLKVLAMPALGPVAGPANAPLFDDVTDLLYSTYIGTTASDTGYAIDVDTSGSAYITGCSAGSTFPTTTGAFDTTNTSTDAFVTKFNVAASRLLFSTFFGGAGADCGTDIAVADDGTVYVTGDTESSSGLPITGSAAQSTFGGVRDAFVAKLNASGDALVFSTYIGGSSGERSRAIGIDRVTHDAYIAGVTDSSSDFPLASAYDSSASGSEGFVTRLNSSGAIVYSTYLGGSSSDEMHDLAVDPSGSGAVFIVGSSLSTNFPVTTSRYQGSKGGDWDAVVVKLNSNGTAAYATYFGGANSECEKSGDNKECAIAVGEDGAAYITSMTNTTQSSSPAFPLVNAVDGTYNGNIDAFVAGLNSTGTGLIFSTFLGGSSNETGYDASYNTSRPDIAVDLAGDGSIFVVGSTNSSDFPTTSSLDPVEAFQQSGQGGYDGYIVKYDSSGSVLYSTYLGGDENEGVRGIAIAKDGSGAAFITGVTLSSDFPVSGAPYDGVYSGGSDGDIFVTKLRAGGSAVAPELPASQAFATNECPFCNNRLLVYTTGLGINAGSGNFNYQHVDGQVAGVGARLSFEPSYNSLTTGADSSYPTYDDTLGVGWTHNFNVHLVFEGDPDGETDVVRLIAPRGSILRFTDPGTGLYTPFPGVLAELTRIDLGGSVYEYHILTNSQYEYVFNATGQLETLIDPQGHAVTLTYADGHLDQVVDASATRYLQFSYEDDRVDTVSFVDGEDNTVGTASYSYDGNGDLTDVTDLDGRHWQYVYDDHLLTQIIDPSLKTLVATTFDGLGRATAQEDGAGNRLTEILSYSGDTRPIRTDAVDNDVVTTVTYAQGVPVSVEAPDDSETLTTFVGQNITPGEMIDARGNATQLTWVDGNLTAVLDALGGQTSLTYDPHHNLIQLIDPLTHITHFAYDGTLLTESIANYGDGSYDPGEPDKDLITQYTYTVSPADDPQPPNLLKTVTDPRGIETVYAYTPQGQIASVTQNYDDGDFDPAQPDQDLTTSYTYTTADDSPQPIDLLKTTTDPLSRVTFNEYDSAGNLIRVTRNYDDGHSQNYENTYNLVTEYTYDDAGRQTTMTDTLGRVTQTCYDEAGRVVKTIQNPSDLDPCGSYTPGGDPAQDRITLVAYDGNGDVIATTNPDGVVTRTYYDTRHRPVTTIQNLTDEISTILDEVTAWDSAHPDQNVRMDSVYDSVGNVQQTIDNTGRVTYNCYDALNRVVKTIQNPTELDPCETYTASSDADQDLITQTIYDDTGNVIATVDPGGHITRTYYDALNRPYVVVHNLTATTVSDPTPSFGAFATSAADEDLATETFYDAAGRVYKTLDLNTVRADWTCYNDAGRVTRTILNVTIGDPCEGAGEGAPLDASHGENTDENLSTDYFYDAAGRQIAVMAPDGTVTRTYYDNADRRIAVTNNLVYRIDTEEQPVLDGITISAPLPYDGENYPDETLTTVYDYDALGRLLTTTDNAGLVNATCYDALGRNIKSIQNPTDGAPCGSYTESANPDEDIVTQTTYDGASDAIAMTDAAGRIARTYFDALHRVRYVVANLSGQSVSESSPPSFSADQPDQNLRQETLYDGAGRPFQTVDNDGLVTQTNYDALDRPIAVITNYVTPDPEDDQTNLTRETTYDKLGNVMEQTDANGVVTRYGYDNANRLTTVIENYDSGGPTDNETNVQTKYTYDWHGNRLTIESANSVLNHDDVYTTYTYDKLDRNLTEATPDEDLTTHTYSLQGLPATLLDANGQTTHYSYDGLRRLTNIDYPSGTDDVTFAYDAAGNRQSMTDATETSWAFDSLYRPTQINATFGEVGYSYDKLGLRQSLTYPDSKGVVYLYDGLNRLKTVATTGTAPWVIEPDLASGLVGGWTFTEGTGTSAADYSNYSNAGTLENGASWGSGHRDTGVVLDGGDDYVLVPDSSSLDVTGTGLTLAAWVKPATTSGTHMILAKDGAFALALDDGALKYADSIDWAFVGSFGSIPTNSWSYVAVTFDGALLRFYVNGMEVGTLEHSGSLTDNNSPLCLGAADSACISNFFDGALDDVSIYSRALSAVEIQSATLGAIPANYTYGDFGQLSSLVYPNGVTTAYDYDTAHRLTDITHLAPPALGGAALAHYAYTLDKIGNRMSVTESIRLPLVSAIPSVDDSIFADGFETGDLSAWSDSETDGGALTASTGAGLIGTYGLAAALDGGNSTAAQYVEDDSPAAESRYRARFYFDPNSVIMEEADSHPIFYGIDTISPVLRVEFGYTSGDYQVRASILDDSNSWVNSSWVTVSDDPHILEFDGQAASGDDANDGHLTFWVDGSQSANLADIDNPNWQIDTVRLGVTAGLDEGTSGTEYFDGFESRHQAYIGADTSRSDVIFADDFESGALTGWNDVVQDGGTLTVTNGAALAGANGLAVTIDGANSTSSTELIDTLPAHERQYRARFYYDPNSLTMDDEDTHTIFNGEDQDHQVAVRLEFGYASSDYRVRALVRDDAGDWAIGDWVIISDAPHVIEFFWKAASGEEAEDGSLTLWIDTAQVSTLSGIDNDTRQIDIVQLGMIDGVDEGTSGTEYFDAFESRRSTYIGSGTALPEIVFADGFESGDLSYWSESGSEGNPPAVTMGAALDGTQGMAAALDGSITTDATFVRDDTPNAESRYRARFYFDPNSIVMDDNDGHTLFYGSNYTDDSEFELDFSYSSGQYYIEAALNDDSDSWTYGGPVALSDGPHSVEIDWKAASAPAADDGYLTLWVDQIQVTHLTSIDNDTMRIDRVRLGAFGVDEGTSGAEYFDGFESRRQSYTGSEIAHPDAIFSDGFESGDLTGWSSSETASDTLTVTTSAALLGDQGLATDLDGSNNTDAKYVVDDSPEAESRYRARFYFDPNAVTMAEADSHPIFYGLDDTTAVVRVEFGYNSSKYQVRVGVLDDSSSWTDSDWVTVSDAPHTFEIDWQAATGDGADNGTLKFWVDDALQADLKDTDNDLLSIDSVQLGVVAGLDEGTIGTEYFDAFESRRETAIGSVLGLIETTTIDYVYDPLYRLTEANYSDGRYFHYVYDANGNRLSETKCLTVDGCGAPTVTEYVYNDSNQLSSVNAQDYDFDDNGNLLDDGVNTYTYDAANRLSIVTGNGHTSTYTYNGLGDRLSQTVDSVTTDYALDLSGGLTQVLNDGNNTYLYGNGRIGELQPGGFEYHLGDALGSVRQLTDESGDVNLARSYEPFGTVLTSAGTSSTVISFTGEMLDSYIKLYYLRARWLSTDLGRFTSKDTYQDYSQPLTLNGWSYTDGNPINRVDPNGHWWWGFGATLYTNSFRRFQSQNVHVRIQGLWMSGREEEIQAEYIIPGTDLPVDLLDSITGEMWEIKPWADVVDGRIAINARVRAMIAASNAELLTGMAPNAMPYNWNYAPVAWYYGQSFPAEVYIGTDETGNYDIYAGQTEFGVISWWKYNRTNRQQVQDPIYLPWGMKRSVRNERPDWRPAAIPVGAAALTWDDPAVIKACETALAVVITTGILLDPAPGDELVLPAVWAPVFSN